MTPPPNRKKSGAKHKADQASGKSGRNGPQGVRPQGQQPPQPIDMELSPAPAEPEATAAPEAPAVPKATAPEQVFFSETQANLAPVPDNSPPQSDVKAAPELGRVPPSAPTSSAAANPPAVSPPVSPAPLPPVPAPPTPAPPVPKPNAAPTSTPSNSKPKRTPSEERNRARFLTFLRLFTGSMLLFALAYFMWTDGTWATKLLTWVLLVILADEFAGWFGYIGLLLGGLGYLSPTPPPAEWLVILPLVGGALFALLLIKHSGGPLVLPFAGALFAGTLYATAKFGLKFDPALKLPSNETFLRTAMIAMLIGLSISFIRQFIGLYLRRRARIRARQNTDLNAIPTSA